MSHERFQKKSGFFQLLGQCDRDRQHGGCIHLIQRSINRLSELQEVIQMEPDLYEALQTASDRCYIVDETIRGISERIMRLERSGLGTEQEETERNKVVTEFEKWQRAVWDPLRKRVAKLLGEILKQYDPQ